jgi:hypothetical protein
MENVFRRPWSMAQARGDRLARGRLRRFRGEARSFGHPVIASCSCPFLLPGRGVVAPACLRRPAVPGGGADGDAGCASSAERGPACIGPAPLKGPTRDSSRRWPGRRAFTAFSPPPCVS